MFDQDEEELELLRQYEDKDLAEDDENRSSDDMDSDLEDKIMSMVQYGSGISKKKASAPPPPPPSEAAAAAPAPSPSTEIHATHPPAQSNVQANVVYAPVDNNVEASQKTAVSSANIYQIDDTDSEDDTPAKAVYSDEDEDESEGEEEETEDIGVPELTTDVPAETPVHEPQVTRFINLDQEEKRYMDDEDTSEEEAELESKLQQLIDDQIYNRQSKKRYHEKNIRVCFNCHTPGHERIDCKLCMDCGLPKHKDARCVGARYCSRCKYRGHNAIDCTNERTYESCRHCGASYHHSDVCPSILHSFTGEVAAKSTPAAWCYNCNERGHYGDECPDLPQYKTTLPSSFSKLSVGLGSRFDPKKAKKLASSSSPSSYHGSSYTANKHQRWSDSSRESSPRYDHRDNRKRARYNHNDSDDDYSSSRYTRRDAPAASSSSKNNSNSKKRQKTNNQGLDGFFSHQQGTPSSSSRNNNNNNNNKPNHNSRSGNNNWKAMNNNSLPQPTRSGTVKVNSYSRQQQQRQDYGDFPRGNNNTNNLPRPSASGVIDLTGDDNNNNSNRGGSGGGGEYSSNRRPKYHGGYSRNR